jgi:hypothetical protein
VGPYICQLTNEYVGLQRRPKANVCPYSHRLTDESKSFIFLLQPVLAASPDGEPAK